MAKLTPEQEARYAVRWNVSRSDLPAAAQLEYDRLQAEREREAAAAREPAVSPPARRVIPSARWSRFAGATMILGLLTGFYGTIPAGVALFNTDHVATAAHFSNIQDVIAWTAFGLVVAGPSLTLYFTVRYAKRASVLASTFGVTVFNWNTVTLPWHNITGVILTPVTRFTRHGWVPGIVQKDGQVVPVSFAAFIPAGRRTLGPAPQMPASGEAFEVAALIRRGLDAHRQDAGDAAGTVSGQVAPEAGPGQDPLALPPTGGQPWTGNRLAISREWIAYKDVTGAVPWNVIPYATVSSMRPAPGGGITIGQPDGLSVVVGKAGLASPEAAALLAEGLAANTTVAPAAHELLRPYLDAARLKRDARAAARHAVDRSESTHTFRLQRGLLLASGIAVMVGSAACLGLAVAAPLSGWSSRIGSKGDEVWAVALGLLCLWFGVRLLRVGVLVTGEKLTIRSYLRTHTVDNSQIRAITLQPKVLGQGVPVWIPRVDLTDGTSIWITSFECGPAHRPPRLDRVATVDEIRGLLGVSADNIGTLARRQHERKGQTTDVPGAPGAPKPSRSLGLATGVGSAVAIACALVLGVLGGATDRQYLYGAVILGVLVGRAVRQIRRDTQAAVSAALISLAGGALASLIALTMHLVQAVHIPLSALLAHLSTVMSALPHVIGWFGFLCWALAAFTAWAGVARAQSQDPPRHAEDGVRPHLDYASRTDARAGEL
jgi:hypothetical protein